MTDDDFPGGVDPTVEAAAAQPIDRSDAALLDELAELLTTVDPVPDDLVERIQFSLALDEMYAEIASITRMEHDALAVRSEPVAGTRTETLTFSADSLTAMVTVTRHGAEQVRLDGWLAPPVAMRVQLRMQEGTKQVLADASGRFVLDGLPEGFAQLSFHPADEADDTDGAGVVVTPLFQL
jgi:hypothetical protein